MTIKPMSNAPRKAILLAAGFGTRMKPLSYDTPKPLMPLWGIPLIEHSINLLISWGVKDILINVHHAPEQILKYCQSKSFKSCRIQISFEPEILGTGGAVKKAAWFIGNKPFWMLNTDVAADLDPNPLIKSFKQKKAIASLWMHQTLGPRTVEIHNQKITNFASPTPGTENTYTFCGLQLLSPKIIEYLPKTKFCSIVDGYRTAMKKGETVLGITVEKSFWADLGTRERYLNAHRDILEARKKMKPGKKLLLPSQLKKMTARIPKNVKVNGFATLGDNVTIVDNVILNDCVVWDNVTIANINAFGMRASRRHNSSFSKTLMEPGCPHPENASPNTPDSIDSSASIKQSIIGNNLSLYGCIDSSSAVKCNTLPTNDSVLQFALKALRAKPENTCLIALPARGSNRSFERIQTKRKSAILIRYDNKIRLENARYANHTEFLKLQGISVPGVLLDLPNHNATLFEDAGTKDLEAIAKHLSNKQLISVYKRVLDQLVLLHSIPHESLRHIELEPEFDCDLYAWECNLLTTHFLQNHLNLAAPSIRKITKELTLIPEILNKSPRVLLHRDMQSSNVILKNSKPMIIDFQGMRLGVAEYDLASLICDPYVMLPENTQNILLSYYHKKRTKTLGSKPGNPLTTSVDMSLTSTIFTAAAIQRLAQALGAFSRLSKISDMQHYKKYIPKACSMMLRMLKTRNDMPELLKTLQSLEGGRVAKL